MDAEKAARKAYTIMAQYRSGKISAQKAQGALDILIDEKPAHDEYCQAAAEIKEESTTAVVYALLSEIDALRDRVNVAGKHINYLIDLLEKTISGKERA